jgi:hypothetical protein
MEKTIKETTRLLLNGTLTKEYADKILLDLYNVNGSVADSVGRNCPFCGEPCVECSHKATDR